MNLYNSILSIDIPSNSLVERNALEGMTNLNSIKCNPNILNKLPLNKNGFNNIVYLIIKEKINKLTKNMFKNCFNLLFISIPLSVNDIELGTFDNCPNIRIVQCNPALLDAFKNNYITSLLIPEGVDNIFMDYFLEKKHLENIQNLYIPRSVNLMDEGTFYNYKKIIDLNCDLKWNNYNYFPFRCEIEEGRKTLTRDDFREWFNLKSLIIPNSIENIYPLTFSDSLNIEELNCSPKFFHYLYVKNVKVLVIPEGVERIEKNDFKDFNNLIYLKLPDSLNFIDEKAFNNTPCLNFDNISNHPLLYKLKKEKVSKAIIKSKENNNSQDNIPRIDLPNYDFEVNQNKNNKIFKNIEELMEENKVNTNEDKIENNTKNDLFNLNENSIKNERKNDFFKGYYKNINYMPFNNYFDNLKNTSDNNTDRKIDNKYNNRNKIKNKQKIVEKGEKKIEKTERTVEDIINYDPSNSKFAPFITQILDSIDSHFLKVEKGKELKDIAFKLAEICLKICSNTNYQFKPRPVQLLAILRLAYHALYGEEKGSIGEIKTGEGKSFIVSTLATLLCSLGKKIDIITTSIELAARDQKNQEKNFELFNISSGVLYKEEEKEYLKNNKSYEIKIDRGYDLEVFEKQIVYSTNSNFEFVYLNSMFISEPLRPYKRKYDIVIVDEVDNMFIDQGTSPALISRPCNVIHYRDILNIIYYNRHRSIQELQKTLDMIFNKCAFFNNEEALEEIKLLKEAALISDKKLKI